MNTDAKLEEHHVIPVENVYPTTDISEAAAAFGYLVLDSESVLIPQLCLVFGAVLHQQRCLAFGVWWPSGTLLQHCKVEHLLYEFLACYFSLVNRT